jgi:hypothetical protein
MQFFRVLKRLFLQDRAVKQFGSADADYGKKLRERIDFYKTEKKNKSSHI